MQTRDRERAQIVYAFSMHSHTTKHKAKLTAPPPKMYTVLTHKWVYVIFMEGINSMSIVVVWEH